VSDELTIEYLTLDALRPDPRNARTHSKKQVQDLANLMREVGFKGTILINPERTIIAGHCRLRAAKLVGLDKVPTITVHGLTPQQENLLRIADNKMALNSGWDMDLLKIQLGEIRADGLNLELTGFSVGEIDVALKLPSDPDDEVVPAVPRLAVSRPGDTWICADHRVHCGNLLDDVSLPALMAGELADLAVFDAPYNVKINGFANAKGRHAEFKMASGEMSPDEFRIFIDGFIGAHVRFCRDGAVNMAFMDWRHIDDLIVIGRRHYGEFLNLVVWRKSNAGMGSLYRSQHELLAVFRVGDEPHFNAVELGRHGRNRTNVFEYASVNSFRGSRREDLALHPTVKPSALYADVIRDVTRPGEIVLDGFLGSGTALIAAELTGRRARGLEIEPGYVDVAVERWMAMTGQEAILESTGEAFGARQKLALAEVAPEVEYGS
jgi:DNA modification methylase